MTDPARHAVIVGGAGFIGSHLVDALLAGGWRVTVYDRQAERYRATLEAVSYVRGSLGERGRLRPLLDGADIAFHLASTTVPATSNESPVHDIETNLVDSIGFLDACVAAQVGKVVFLSSGGTVYGIPEASPVVEDHPQHPICSYAIVKLAIEKYLGLYHHLHGLAYTVLRPANPYGPRQDPQGKQGAIGVFLGRIARGEPITIWGDGEIVRDYFHVADLARACVAAAESPVPGAVLNLGSGEGRSLNELIATMEAVIGQPVAVDRRPPRPFDVDSIVLDVGRARRDLGWTPRVSLEDGLVDTWRWVQAQYPASRPR